MSAERAGEGFMEEMALLKLVLGLCLMTAGWLLFSIWQERLAITPPHERTHFLMYQWVGGAWIFALFSACGGAYFVAESIMRMT